jgi:hypothetical protein
MKTWISQCLGADGAEVAFSWDGLAPGWAILLFVVLGGAAAWGYWRFDRSVGPARRTVMAVLRVLALAIVCLLLVRPVILFTTSEPVREVVPVLLDVSESMTLVDVRKAAADRARLAIALDRLSPDTDVASVTAPDVSELSRGDVLRAVGVNPRLDLWNRIAAVADIKAYGVGDSLVELPMPEANGESFQALLSKVPFTVKRTALGEALQDVLDRGRSRIGSGVILITDGANNSGIPPSEVAAQFGAEGIPIFIYGIGVTGSPDLILEELVAPRVASPEETIEVVAPIRALGYVGQNSEVIFLIEGVEKERKTVTIPPDGKTSAAFSYQPEKAGSLALEIQVEGFPDEASAENNKRTIPLRVIDEKLKVLLVDQAPRWDFRYLLSALENDRRLDVDTFLIFGDPKPEGDKPTPFLAALPKARDELFSYEVIILGDVDPVALGADWIKLLDEWVGSFGGSLLFLAGTEFNPSKYGGTGLGPLLPVEPTARTGETVRFDPPHRLNLTAAGLRSPLLRLVPSIPENEAIWNSFPPVNWVAEATARPTAETLLVDATVPARPVPVIATQRYGAGQMLYFGTDQTFRWRSRVGERYHVQIWRQIMQSLSLDRRTGASQLTQLRVEKPDYLTGDKGMVSGRLLTPDFQPLKLPSVEAVVEVLGKAGETVSTSTVQLQLAAGGNGEYSVEIPLRTPGSYKLHTRLDPEAKVRWEVAEPNVEFLSPTMDEALLESVAKASGGELFREETLAQLPDKVRGGSTVETHQTKLEWYLAAWLGILLLVLLLAEWTLRRLWSLK